MQVFCEIKLAIFVKCSIITDMLSVIGSLFGNRNELLEIVNSLSEKNGELNTKNEEQNTIIHRQEEQIEEQSTIIHRHEDQIKKLEQKLQWFEGQFHLLRHKRFGASSEQTPAAQGNLFNEAEVIAEQEPAKEAELETITYERKKPGRKALPEDLPRERREYELPDCRWLNYAAAGCIFAGSSTKR